MEGQTAIDKLHDDILNRLPEDFVRRMRNWSASMSGAPVSIGSALWDMAGTRGVFESRVPVLMGEADDTQAAVYKLIPLQQETVSIFWLYQARTLSWMARATPIVRAAKLGPTSFRQTLDAGHERLIVLLAIMGAAAAVRRRAMQA